MRKLCDPVSPWWAVAYTKLAAKTVSFILLEICHSFWLWELSQEVIRGIQRLTLETILGNTGNAREFLSFFEEIESSKFQELPALWLCRGRLPSL